MPTEVTVPVVTIGMPVFNGEVLVRRALESLLAQDFKPVEIAVHDNASTDRTAAIVQELAERDSRIRFVRNERNIGPMANFREALKGARGKYFMWAAHDDAWSADYVGRLVRLLGERPDQVLAAGQAVFTGASGKPLGPGGRSGAPGSSPETELLDWHATHWIYGVFDREALLGLSDGLWSLRPWGGDMVWLLSLVCDSRVAGDDDALIYKMIKDSPLEPRLPRDRLNWELWYGRSILRAVLASRLPPHRKLRVLRVARSYLWQQSTRGGARRTVMKWVGALLNSGGPSKQ